MGCWSTLSRAAALMALAAPAWAECPEPGALDTDSIRLDYNNGLWEVFSRFSPDVVQVVGRTAQGPVHVMWLTEGVYFIKVSSFDAAGEVADELLYTYSVETAELPVPAPGDSWEMQVSIELIGGTDDPYQQRQQISMLPAESVVISGCVLEAIPVRISYLGENPYVEILHYLPDLGISYLYSTRTGPTAPEVSRALMIRMVE